MFIKMRESKGFTLVELMIVVAIIGILAAVAVPYYQKYIQKSRLTSLVMPGVHSVQTNLASYYSLNGAIPTTAATVTVMAADGDSTYYSVAVAGTAVTFTIKAGGGKLPSLVGQVLKASAMSATANMITGWTYSGTLATTLGMEGLQ